MDSRYFQLLTTTFEANKRGQSTVEAAFCLPLIFILLLILIQPSILLYDRVVMESAAAEACRLLATLPADQNSLVEKFIHRRLGSVPPHDLFHVHHDECSWDISTAGSQEEQTVEVSITNKAKPLPLLDVAGALTGFTDSDGYLTVEVTRSMQTQPSWVFSSESGSPVEWVGAWYAD